MKTLQPESATVPDTWTELLNKIQQLLDHMVPEEVEGSEPVGFLRAKDDSIPCVELLADQLKADRGWLEVAVKHADQTTAEADAALNEVAGELHSWLGQCRAAAQKLADSVAKPI